jgi:hypothetical protein
VWPCRLQHPGLLMDVLPAVPVVISGARGALAVVKPGARSHGGAEVPQATRQRAGLHAPGVDVL